MGIAHAEEGGKQRRRDPARQTTTAAATQRPRANDDPARWMPGIGIVAGVDRALDARHRRA
ncbi:hypothetical protein AB0D11_47835 [Streptomyces monashensis]|uniref:hypothetical protein n=1 Tax=Streptomyces monashensis TaxID=1678012 RepID=UPI0033CF70F4